MLPSFKPYEGLLYRDRMSEPERLAYEAFCGQRARSKKAGLPKPTYSAKEFIGWWLECLKTFKGTVPTCGRKDHSKGYSWDNIEMQDMADNSREGIVRNQTNIKTSINTGKKVHVLCKRTGKIIAIIPSIREAAQLFDVSQRLVQFVIRGKYKSASKINFDLVGAI